MFVIVRKFREHHIIQLYSPPRPPGSGRAPRAVDESFVKITNPNHNALCSNWQKCFCLLVPTDARHVRGDRAASPADKAVVKGAGG